MTSQNTPSIWKWKNTAHITKTTMEFGFAVAAVAIAATTIYAAAKGVVLSSALPAFLANPWVIAAIVSYVAIYFVARSISSYQQLYSMEGAKGQDGTSGANGKNADFSALLSDAIIKSGTIVVETVKNTSGNDVEQLSLKLPILDYKALAKNNEPVHVLLADKQVALEHVVPADGATEYKVKVVSVNGKTDNMKSELGMAKEANSLEVKVSNQNYKTLENHISTKLTDTVIGVVPAAKAATK